MECVTVLKEQKVVGGMGEEKGLPNIVFFLGFKDLKITSGNQIVSKSNKKGW